MTKNKKIINADTSIQETPSCLSDKIESKAYQNVLSMNTIACLRSKQSKDDLDSAKQECHNGMISLVKGENLKNMLAAQMLSIHQLQQTSMFMANSASEQDNRQYYTNSSIKLANAFTQQAALLAKLQGDSVHKIVVERVEVHSGGQAVVGDINTGKQ